MLLRILQAHGKATEFLATIVLEEVKNLGKYYCCDMFLIQYDLHINPFNYGFKIKGGQN